MAIKVGKKYFPYIGESKADGKYTLYTVSNKKYEGEQNGKKVYSNHGWVKVLAKIDHPLPEKSGEYITIKSIEGVDIQEYPEGSGKYKTTIYAEVTVGDGMPPASPHDDDIPNGFHRDDGDEIPF